MVFILTAILLWANQSFTQENKNPAYSVPSLEHQSSFVTKAEQNSQPSSEDNQINAEDNKKNRSGSTSYSNAFMPPPGNDICAAGLNPPYVLSPNAGCLSGSLNGTPPMPAATIEAGETFGCMTGPPTRSVWYSFIATQANMWVSTKQTGTPGPNTVCALNFGIRIYRYSGTCPPAGGGGCKAYTFYSANQIHNVLNLTTLTPGTTYLVQIACDPLCSDFNFCIKLGTPTTCTTCGNSCGPICTFAQPSPPTVPQVVTTCPGYPLSPPVNQFDIQTNCYTFTAPNDTVNMQQVVYAYCSPGNTFSFTYNLYTSGCGFIQGGNVFANNMITGLTVGQTYQICYTLQAACSWDSLIYPYLYTTSTTLPVDLVSFEALAYKEKVQLYWTTASEENCKEYIIERTLNSRDFTEVARVQGAGNSVSLLNYESVDNSPVEGNNYYRLKQIDFNGEFTYTKLVAVKFSTSAADLYIVPNPALDKAFIKFNAAGNYVTFLKVMDMKGKIIFHKQFISDEGLNEYSLNMAEMARGIYSVQLIVEDQNLVSKLVKE